MNVIERLKTVAGEDFNSRECRVTNPRITARESIEIANYIVKLENELSEAKQKSIMMNHVALELHGVITEFRSMPCSSLKTRMFDAADCYFHRIKRSD